MKKNSLHRVKIEPAVRACEAIRRDTKAPVDITLSEYMKINHDLSMEQLYDDIGINPNVDTIQNLVNMPDPSYRWLIPELFRDALRLGLRKAPIYKSLISGEQTVSQTTITMPAINMSEASPKTVGVAETIQTGTVSFDKKTVSIHKLGRGIKVPYEVINYVSLNLVSIFLQDFGVKLGMGIDNWALQTLLNGDQADGSDSCAVIGIATANTLTFRDTLKPYVRLSRLGKNLKTMVGGEDMTLDLLELFTNTRTLGDPRFTLNVKSPIPTSADIFVHGKIPNNQVLIIDPKDALIKLNAQPLLIETEKIVSNQTEATYATLTTGFATIFRDSRIILDKSVAFGTFGFPTWMDPTPFEILDINVK